jgi:hypothetical protein
MTTPPAPTWRKSSYSVNGAQCVELADAGAEVLLRDSKDPDQGFFAFTRPEMAAFVAGVKAGEFDDMA